MDMLQLKEMGAIRRLVKLGAAYAARLEDMGVYDRFDMAAVALGAGERARGDADSDAAQAQAAAPTR
jgi:hypothetical protein